MDVNSILKLMNQLRMELQDNDKKIASEQRTIDNYERQAENY